MPFQVDVIKLLYKKCGLQPDLVNIFREIFEYSVSSTPAENYIAMCETLINANKLIFDETTAELVMVTAAGKLNSKIFGTFLLTFVFCVE